MPGPAYLMFLDAPPSSHEMVEMGGLNQYSSGHPPCPYIPTRYGGEVHFSLSVKAHISQCNFPAPRGRIMVLLVDILTLMRQASMCTIPALPYSTRHPSMPRSADLISLVHDIMHEHLSDRE